MTTNRSMGLLDKGKEEEKKWCSQLLALIIFKAKKKCVMRFLLFMICTVAWKIKRYVVGD